MLEQARLNTLVPMRSTRRTRRDEPSGILVYPAEQKMSKNTNQRDVVRVCRQQLKLLAHLDAEDNAQLLENMAVDALVTGNIKVPMSLEKEIDAVTLDSVNKVRAVYFFVLFLVF